MLQRVSADAQRRHAKSEIKPGEISLRLYGFSKQFQKQFYLRQPVIGLPIQNICISYKGCYVVKIKLLCIAVKILQADLRQDTPAETIARHFHTGVDIVNAQFCLQAGETMRSKPGLDFACQHRIRAPPDIRIIRQRPVHIFFAAHKTHWFGGQQMNLILPGIFPPQDCNGNIVLLEHPVKITALASDDLTFNPWKSKIYSSYTV